MILKDIRKKIYAGVVLLLAATLVFCAVAVPQVQASDYKASYIKEYEGKLDVNYEQFLDGSVMQVLPDTIREDQQISVIVKKLGFGEFFVKFLLSFGIDVASGSNKNSLFGFMGFPAVTAAAAGCDQTDFQSFHWIKLLLFGLAGHYPNYTLSSNFRLNFLHILYNVTTKCNLSRGILGYMH